MSEKAITNLISKIFAFLNVKDVRFEDVIRWHLLFLFKMMHFLLKLVVGAEHNNDSRLKGLSHFWLILAQKGIFRNIMGWMNAIHFDHCIVHAGS